MGDTADKRLEALSLVETSDNPQKQNLRKSRPVNLSHNLGWGYHNCGTSCTVAIVGKVYFFQTFDEKKFSKLIHQPKVINCKY